MFLGHRKTFQDVAHFLSFGFHDWKTDQVKRYSCSSHVGHWGEEEEFEKPVATLN